MTATRESAGNTYECKKNGLLNNLIDDRQLTMKKKNKGKTFPELEAFKGGAILLILMYHYTIRYNTLYSHTLPFPPISSYGRFGVELFFITSGFLITMSLERVKNNEDFIFNRISRLYPAYWASIFITFTCVSLFPLPGRTVTTIEALLNLTMLQDWMPGVAHVDGSYWTMSSFLSFYFIMYLIKKKQKIERIESICALWLIAICSSKIAEYALFPIHHVIKTTFLLEHGNMFILGITFYRIKSKGNTITRNILILSALFTQFLFDNPPKFLFICIFIALYYLFLKNNLQFLRNPVIIFIGRISYALYLIHQNIGYIIIRKLYQNDMASHLAILILPTTISLILASIITCYIEEPSKRYLRKQYYTHL